jgi:hypothetical protein
VARASVFAIVGTMTEPLDGLPRDVRLLLGDLDSIGQLELLLALYRHAPEGRTVAQLSAELRIDATWTREQLAILAARDLLEGLDSARTLYRYSPATPELAKAVEALAISYAERRVSVVAALYAKPTRGIRVFADAFRLRRSDDEEG